ncbi:hypothetical protein ACVWYN_001021 [Pedobacter sp. UYP24]
MNDNFNLKRFSWLFIKTIFERPSQILGLLGLSLIITLIIYGSVQQSAGIGKAQVASFLIGFVLGGSFMASTVFNYFNSTASGISFLMLPASNFEKWFCAILIAGVIFPVIYLGVYRLIDIEFVNRYHNSLDPSAYNYKKLYDGVDLFSFDNNIAKMVYMVLVNVAGAMLVGSLYFNKVSFIKVALVLCAILSVLYFLNLLIGSILFDGLETSVPYRSVFLKIGDNRGILNLPEGINQFTKYIAYYILPIILWLTAYIRLSEKEM